MYIPFTSIAINRGSFTTKYSTSCLLSTGFFSRTTVFVGSASAPPDLSVFKPRHYAFPGCGISGRCGGDVCPPVGSGLPYLNHDSREPRPVAGSIPFINPPVGLATEKESYYVRMRQVISPYRMPRPLVRTIRLRQEYLVSHFMLQTRYEPRNKHRLPLSPAPRSAYPHDRLHSHRATRRRQNHGGKQGDLREDRGTLVPDWQGLFHEFPEEHRRRCVSGLAPALTPSTEQSSTPSRRRWTGWPYEARLSSSSSNGSAMRFMPRRWRLSMVRTAHSAFHRARKIVCE